MKLLSFITRSRIHPRKGNPGCPYCGEYMWEMGLADAFDGKVNPAEEPKHCYRCRNEKCGERPLYRRMDMEVDRAAKQAEAAWEMREQEHRSFLALNEEIVTLTKWLREQRPDKIGSANKLSDILISILEEKPNDPT